MSTIYYYRNNSDISVFYKSNVTNPQEEVDSLNNDEDNFIDDEQICSFHFEERDYEEHEFYGYSSREEMMNSIF